MSNTSKNKEKKQEASLCRMCANFKQILFADGDEKTFCDSLHGEFTGGPPFKIVISCDFFKDNTID